MKRIIPILLCLILVLGMFPVKAFAVTQIKDMYFDKIQVPLVGKAPSPRRS